MLLRLRRLPFVWTLLLGASLCAAPPPAQFEPSQPPPEASSKPAPKEAPTAAPPKENAPTPPPEGAPTPTPPQPPGQGVPPPAPVPTTPTPTPTPHKPEPFVSPSIEELLGQLRALQPLPFEKVWRNPPSHPPQERARLAFLTGRLIADGFLVVAAERANKAEPVGRSLLRMAESLGFGAKIRARGKAVIEKAKKERWSEARLELVLTQADADSALRALNDEELVTLVGLGGWLRGLEITTTAVADDYSPQRAAQLWRPNLARSALVQLQTFRPATRESPIVRVVRDSLDKIAAVVGDEGKPLELADVQKLRDLAKAVNSALNVE